MADGRKIVAWGGGLVSGLILIGLGIFLLRLGLDKAALVATVVGTFTGLAGLGVSIWTLFLARSGSRSQPPGEAPGNQYVQTSVFVNRARKVNHYRGDGRR
jgi:hypothetical protein